MKPIDYLTTWLPILYGIHPNDWGARTKCREELERITGISQNTIKSWGADFELAPIYVQKICDYMDFINSVNQDAKKFEIILTQNDEISNIDISEGT